MGSERFGGVCVLVWRVRKSFLISSTATGGDIPSANILGQFTEVC